MPILSDRSRSIPHSPIRKLAHIADEAKARGIHIYQLNIGQPNLPAPSSIIDNFHKFAGKMLPYAPSEGIKATRQAWSKYLAKQNIDFDPEEIIITNGASEAITMSLAAIAGAEEEILVFQPCYANYLSFAAQTEVHLIPIPLNQENNFHLPDEQIIISRITHRTRAILLCNPANPTGTVFSKQELKLIADIAKKYDLFIITDEVYREFVFDNNEVNSFCQFTDIADNIILIDSISKRFSSCGVRIGCVASKNQKFLNLVLRFAQARLSVATLEQLVVIDILNDTNGYIENVRQEYEQRRNIITTAINQIANVKCSVAEGAFYSLIELPVIDSQDFCSWLLSDFNLDHETVLLTPAKGFYITPHSGLSQVRISYMESPANLLKCAKIIKAGLQAYLSKFPQNSRLSIQNKSL